MGEWTPLGVFCLLAGLVVWAVLGFACVRLVLAHRRACPPEAVACGIIGQALPLHARMAALDALFANGHIGADEHAMRHRELRAETVDGRR